LLTAVTVTATFNRDGVSMFSLIPQRKKEKNQHYSARRRVSKTRPWCRGKRSVVMHGVKNCRL